jgi:hypothetical protein
MNKNLQFNATDAEGIRRQLSTRSATMVVKAE